MKQFWPLFLAASLGCLILAGYSLYMGGSVASPRDVQCSRILQRYANEGQPPERGTVDYFEYADCYRVICGDEPGS